MKQTMTVQELCDKLTVLCHEGHAQAQVRHVTGYEVKAITDVKMVGDEIALITSREKEYFKYRSNETLQRSKQEEEIKEND